MATIELHGRINEAGKLEVDLPEGLPAGDVKVTLELPAENADLLSAVPESLYGLWADLNVDISEEDMGQARSER
jgi:hypothetical protein